ncbi:hypothetical protein KXV22_002833 [Aspergillus fumigatus]|uniref:Uncharacterized protein n=1 Tax=Aspergillus fumigatus TaxID=746128 RepID=A0A8H4MVM9_ASPFM|nr:hypothetical protein CNMCM8686_007883 [Aspergillus fumigatus]KAH1286674.1 hypothetical protein KXX48_000316 [Aspergillus fumigatus]KAH1309167.1 hypothetical protein KXX47_007229 [Aspergillus fumigatus]KAH1433635.1 hypothetical protein KXX22_000205 [Aspergillus fumigatus]KAH1437098.1 hypothetical protein KXX32_003932 [Aspergillus fumigatus]
MPWGCSLAIPPVLARLERQNSMSDMASDQLLYLASQRIIIQDNGKKPDKFMVMQWILTLEGLENAPGTGLEDHSISIESFATRIPYDALF